MPRGGQVPLFVTKDHAAVKTALYGLQMRLASLPFDGPSRRALGILVATGPRRLQAPRAAHT